MSKQTTMAALRDEVLSHIERVTGLKFQEKDKPGIETKLTRHASELGFSNFTEYAHYLRANINSETPKLVSLVTTHHTAFFREFVHFEQIECSLLPIVLREKKDGQLRIWSAAASLGHEAYSLAMFFDELCRSFGSAFPRQGFEILATDIDAAAVARGQNGVYLAREVNQSPKLYLAQHWARGRDELEGWVKARDTLKSKIVFKTENLLKLGQASSQTALQKSDKFDFIFCRNVFLYFTKEQIEKVVQDLLKHLEPWGALFIGVCENLNGLALPVKALGHSIFVPALLPGGSPHLAKEKTHLGAQALQHMTQRTVLGSQTLTSSATLQNSATGKTGPALIRTIVVDDSPTVLALMKRILTAEHGFEVVATAKNLQETKEAVRRVNADLMTLDLHLGAELGTDYLRQANLTAHVPVVLVSALNREQEAVAQEGLRLGAADYVEKPNAAQLEVMADELRAKLRTVIQTHKSKATPLAAQTASAIRVLIVDDSPTMLRVLEQMISSDRRFQVVGHVANPRDLAVQLRKLKPHVLTLDMNMPEMNGVEVLRSLPADLFLPVVVVSSLGLEQGSLVLEALQEGAVDYFPKPALTELAKETAVLLEKLEMASKSQVQKLLLNRAKGRSRSLRPQRNTQTRSSLGLGKTPQPQSGNLNNAIIGIGASTGGTEAIREVLQELPLDLPPIVIVQHIPPVFSAAFAKRLAETCARPVHEAKDGEALRPGHCYVAPGDQHLTVMRSGQGFVSCLGDEPKRNGHKPSVDVLFESLADLRGCAITAVLMTGMGKDGAAGLLRLRQRGAHTICQSERTCVVYGMPRAGVEAGAAEFVEDLDAISNRVTQILKVA